MLTRSRQLKAAAPRWSDRRHGFAGPSIQTRSQPPRAGVWSALAALGRDESVRLCPAISDASSMRGGRSTRASHQSRLRSLTPHRADARRTGMPPEAVSRCRARRGTRRPSRQPLPTQVSGLIPAQLRVWSCEIAAKQGCVRLDKDPTSDDQRRSSRIRPVVRRRFRITRKWGHSVRPAARARAE